MTFGLISSSYSFVWPINYPAVRYASRSLRWVCDSNWMLGLALVYLSFVRREGASAAVFAPVDGERQAVFSELNAIGLFWLGKPTTFSRRPFSTGFF